MPIRWGSYNVDAHNQLNNTTNIYAPNATAADVAQEVIQIQETTAVRNTGTKTPAKPRGSARGGWYD